MADVDVKAVAMIRRYGNLPRCLWVPIAARSINAICRYVGSIARSFSSAVQPEAFIVTPYNALSCPSSCTLRVTAWSHPDSSFFHAASQLWVHVDYKRYRDAYRKSFPDLSLGNHVIDHLQNRREARLRGYNYVRVHHLSRGVNSSSGRGSERLGVNFFRTASGQRLIEAQGDIRYAGTEDLAKMLEVKLGGASLDGLRDVLDWFEPRKNTHSGMCKCEST